MTWTIPRISIDACIHDKNCKYKKITNARKLNLDY